MRAAVLALGIASCASADVVYVPDSSWSIQNANGTMAHLTPAGKDYEAQPVYANAIMSYSVSFDYGPFESGSTSYTVAGVQPGDDYRGSPPLPADCTMIVPTLTSDGNSSTWQLSDPSAIDARLISVGAATCTIPPTSNGANNTIDGSQTMSTDRVNTPCGGSGPGTTVIVTLVACPDEDYDQIRPALVARTGG